MGLDVTAYKKLSKLDAVFDEDGEPIDPQTREPIDDYFRVYSNPDFPGRAEGLVHGGIYAYAEADSFWSGGYGWYNRWREDLAKLAGYPLAERVQYGVREHLHAASAWSGVITEGPFYELVNFADNEGAIGPAVSAKLARDFAEWDDRARATGDEYFYEKYAEWRKCFEFAADGGAVQFH